jgi:DNA-binding transcriptional regulator LsrR (DeoR family)
VSVDGYGSASGVELGQEAITLVQSRYQRLDVAVFGCGDAGDAGWISHAALHLGLRLDRPPVTDVCLNMLDTNAEPIPLVIRGAESEYLGVALRHIRQVARNRLALLLTSGVSKGLPLTLVVRAGCANAVVCDEAAARAALEVLG